MATAFTHTFAAAVLGKTVFREKMPWHFWALGLLCSVLPDFDVAGFRIGIRYGDVLGHRGFMHSLLFALLLGVFVTALAFPAVRWFSRRWWLLAGYFVLATASHGLLDAITNGGYGVAFFSPFDTKRYFFPWHPLEVSPIGIKGFLSPRGLKVMLNEFLWIWAPLLVPLVALSWQRARRKREVDGGDRCNR